VGSCGKKSAKKQSLVGSVVIDVKLDRGNHGLILATATGRGLKPLMLELTTEPDQTGGEKNN
jgi:hypothetical protein